MEPTEESCICLVALYISCCTQGLYIKKHLTISIYLPIFLSISCIISILLLLKVTKQTLEQLTLY